MLALRLRRSLHTSTWPSQAEMWSAVRPSRSMLLTSMPSLRRSSTPFTSPLHAMNSSCIVESRFSGTVSSPASPAAASGANGLLRIGSSDDCLPKLNLRLFRLGSSDACRVNCLLRFRRTDPDENCRDMPRFSCAAMLSIMIDRSFVPSDRSNGSDRENLKQSQKIQLSLSLSLVVARFTEGSGTSLYMFGH